MKRIVAKGFATACFAFAATFAQAADETASKENVDKAATEAPSKEKIEKAHEVFRLAMSQGVLSDLGEQAGEDAADQIDDYLAESDKSLSDEEYDAVVAKFSDAFVKMMTDAESEIVEVYARELTSQDFDILIKLYSDTETAAVLAKLPAIGETLLPEINKRAEKMAPSLVKELQAEGHLTDLPTGK